MASEAEQSLDEFVVKESLLDLFRRLMNRNALSPIAIHSKGDDESRLPLLGAWFSKRVGIQ
jgi:hypothetical protein